MLSKYPQIIQNTKNMKNKLWATNKFLLRLTVQADKGCTPSKLNDQNVEYDVTVTHLNTCKTKTLHEKYTNLLLENHMDKAISLMWLSAGCIYPETGVPVATQDKAIKNYILRESLLRGGSDWQMQKTWKSGQNNWTLNSCMIITIRIRISQETQWRQK